MRRFFSEVMTAEVAGSRVRVWHPSGLWDPPAAHAFAKELGILCALDPLGADPTRDFAAWWDTVEGDDAYFSIGGLGRGRRTPPDQLEALAEIADRFQRAWVVFATSEPFPDAIRFAGMVSTGGSSDGDADAASRVDGDDDDDDDDLDEEDPDENDA